MFTVRLVEGEAQLLLYVIWYLVEHKNMTPDAAYQYVRSIRPRVLLSSSQLQPVQDYYIRKLKRSQSNICERNSMVKSVDFDDDLAVVVTDLDLDGYDADFDSVLAGSDDDSLMHMSLACRDQFTCWVSWWVAVARLSCLWLRNHKQRTVGADQLPSIGADISVC